MGQLSDRVSRVVRANLNASRNESEANNYLNEGAALVVGGAIAGASMGKVGIVAGGAGYSVGAIPLAAIGALTGAALYEAVRSLLENDTSSAGAAAIGAAAGAATSATIGGIGIAAGGSAIGVGMASMAAGGAVAGLGLVGLNRLFQQGLDPEKLLDKAISDMQRDLQKVCPALANVMAIQYRLQRQCELEQSKADAWKQLAQLAHRKGNEQLAREALLCKYQHVKTLKGLQAQLDDEPDSFKLLKRNLAPLITNITEAQQMRTRLKAQIAVAKANGQLQSAAGRIVPSSAMGAFERMEEKVSQLEARSQASAELARADLESLFALLESDNEVDGTLGALKIQLLGTTQRSQPRYPKSDPLDSIFGDTDIDTEL